MTEAVAQDWLKALESELCRIAFDELNPIEKLKQTVSAAEGSLAKLRDYVLADPFSSDQDEIEFFKWVKPQFYCWKIYAFERYSIESWIALLDREKCIRNFLMGELRSVERFFRLHDFHYRYYKKCSSDLDELFFLRKNFGNGSMLVPHELNPDPSFATKGDYLFAKFMALEKLLLWIQQQLLGLDGLAPTNMGQVRGEGLQWNIRT